MKENNEAENLMQEMSSRLDDSNIKIKVETIEEAESIKNIENIKSLLTNVITFCESKKVTNENVDEVINLLIVIFLAYPELKDFFKENLEKSIIKLGFQNKKIDIKKMDPLNKIWNNFFFLPEKQ